MTNEVNRLKEIGCTEIEEFRLINNYGYRFRKSGFKHTLTHYSKDNGKDVNLWTIWSKIFDNFEDAIEFIEQL